MAFSTDPRRQLAHAPPPLPRRATDLRALEPAGLHEHQRPDRSVARPVSRDARPRGGSKTTRTELNLGQNTSTSGTGGRRTGVQPATSAARRSRRRCRGSQGRTGVERRRLRGPVTPASARWPSSSTRTATPLNLHNRYAPYKIGPSCSSATGVPLPTTSDKAWRFTDIAGFDPDAFSLNGTSTVPGTLEGGRALGTASIGVARVSEAGRDRRAPRDHVRAAGRPSAARRAVDGTEKFAAHNAAEWKHGLLVHVPKGVVLEEPLYVRVVNSSPGGALFWRMLVVAEPESRFTVIEEYSSATPELEGYSTRSWSSSSSRRRRSSTSRSRTSPATRGTSPRIARASAATPSSTGSPPASARSAARSGSRTTSPAKERPRA